VDEAGKRGADAAREFLETVKEDEELGRQLDQLVDDQLLSAARTIGATRGFHFSRDELLQAVADRLSVIDFELDSPDGGPGQCKTDSGCRTPCVYCKSNRVPTLSDLGELVEQQRFG
jgi:Nif11 domain